MSIHRYIKIVEEAQTVQEGLHGTQQVDSAYYTGPVDIYVNPTRPQFGKLLREFESLRGFFDNEDVYVWRGDVLHSEIEAPGDHWIEWPGKGTASISWNWDTENEYPGVEDVNQIERYVRTKHPVLKRLLLNQRVIAQSR